MDKVLMCAVILFDLQQDITLIDYKLSQARTISRPFTEDLPEAIVEVCNNTQVYDFFLSAPESYAEHIIEVVQSMDSKINIQYLKGEN